MWPSIPIFLKQSLYKNIAASIITRTGNQEIQRKCLAESLWVDGPQRVIQQQRVVHATTMLCDRGWCAWAVNLGVQQIKAKWVQGSLAMLNSCQKKQKKQDTESVPLGTILLIRGWHKGRSAIKGSLWHIPSLPPPPASFVLQCWCMFQDEPYSQGLSSRCLKRSPQSEFCRNYGVLGYLLPNFRFLSVVKKPGLFWIMLNSSRKWCTIVLFTRCLFKK